MIAAHLRKRRPKPHAVWHLDEVYRKSIGDGLSMARRRREGEALHVLVQSKRNKRAAAQLLRRYAFVLERLATDELAIM